MKTIKNLFIIFLLTISTQSFANTTYPEVEKEVLSRFSQMENDNRKGVEELRTSLLQIIDQSDLSDEEKSKHHNTVLNSYTERFYQATLSGGMRKMLSVTSQLKVSPKNAMEMEQKILNPLEKVLAFVEETVAYLENHQETLSKDGTDYGSTPYALLLTIDALTDVAFIIPRLEKITSEQSTLTERAVKLIQSALETHNAYPSEVYKYASAIMELNTSVATKVAVLEQAADKNDGDHNVAADIEEWLKELQSLAQATQKK